MWDNGVYFQSVLRDIHSVTEMERDRLRQWFLSHQREKSVNHQVFGNVQKDHAAL